MDFIPSLMAAEFTWSRGQVNADPGRNPPCGSATRRAGPRPAGRAPRSVKAACADRAGPEQPLKPWRYKEDG